MARVGVGIDIGSKAVTVAQVKRRGGELTLTAALRLSRPAQPAFRPVPAGFRHRTAPGAAPEAT